MMHFSVPPDVLPAFRAFIVVIPDDLSSQTFPSAVFPVPILELTLTLGTAVKPVRPPYGLTAVPTSHLNFPNHFKGLVTSFEIILIPQPRLVILGKVLSVDDYPVKAAGINVDLSFFLKHLNAPVAARTPVGLDFEPIGVVNGHASPALWTNESFKHLFITPNLL